MKRFIRKFFLLLQCVFARPPRKTSYQRQCEDAKDE